MKQNIRIIIRKVLILFLGGVFTLSCHKVHYDYIDGKNPDERVKEFVDNFRNTLVSSKDGWAAYMYVPANQKGFTFYMQFKENNRVVMYADFVDSTMTTPKESSFQIRNTGIPSLIFDTYNYIHLPADPNGNISGGANGVGQSSDFEYSIIRVTNDTIILKGNLKSCDMTLIRLNSEQAAALKDGKFKQTVDEFTAYFTTSQNNYVPVSDGRKLGISFTNSIHQISYQILESDGTVSSFSGTFFYSVDGIKIANGFQYGGIEYVSGIIKNGTLYLIDNSGNEVQVRQNSTPLTPLSASFGSGKTYKTIHIEGQSLPPGVTSGWNTIFSSMVTRFNNSSGRTILYMEFAIQNAKKARVIIRYQSSSGSQYTADAEYDYEINGNTLTLSNYVPSISNSNWNSRIKDIGDEVVNYFNNASFKIDWVDGSSQELLGGLYPINKPDDFFYGILK